MSSFLPGTGRGEKVDLREDGEGLKENKENELVSFNLAVAWWVISQFYGWTQRRGIRG
jgi:hypothetical protein